MPCYTVTDYQRTDGFLGELAVILLAQPLGPVQLSLAVIGPLTVAFRV